MLDAPQLSEFTASKVNLRGKTRTVYRMGDQGPGVILMHEIPGLTPNVLRLGKLICQNGFRVALPSLFGTDGALPSKAVDAEVAFRMCIDAEFSVFAANGSSAIVDWLRELCMAIARETGSKVGAVGLCITGGFALSLSVGTDGVVRAPVMSEPSLPFPMPFTDNAAAVHLTPAEQDVIRRTRPACMALRFKGDHHCRKERFDTYQGLLGTNLTRIELDSPDPAHGIGSMAHSVLTEELSDAPGHPTWPAFLRVIEFLRANLT
jgi:dienelactone hydrolase